MARQRFALRERVIVPDTGGTIQRVIIGRADFVKAESVCTIAWVNDSGEPRVKSVAVSLLARQQRVRRNIMRPTIINAYDQADVIKTILIVGATACLLFVIGFVVIVCRLIYLGILAATANDTDVDGDSMLEPHGDVPHMVHQAQRPGRDFDRQPVMFPPVIGEGGRG